MNASSSEFVQRRARQTKDSRVNLLCSGTAHNFVGVLLPTEEIHRVAAETSGRRLHPVGGAGLRRRAGGALLDARVAFVGERGGEAPDCQCARIHGIREGALRRSLPEAEEPAGAGEWNTLRMILGSDEATR